MAEQFDITPETPLERVIGAASARKVEQAFGYTLCGEMLGHYPRRYLDVGELSHIASLPFGEEVTIVAEVESVSERRMHSRRGFLIEVVVKDALGPEQGRIRMTFFNGYDARKQLVPGTVAMFNGKVGHFQQHLELAQPDFSVLEQAQDADPKPIPIYPATAKLPNKKIRDVLEILLDGVTEAGFPEMIPGAVLKRHGLLGRCEALRTIHRPAQVPDAMRARHRFVFEEALHLQLALVARRAYRHEQEAVNRQGRPDGLLARFDEQLPFELTDGQLLAGREIADDLVRGYPMNRLLQGEVGSGKTFVAVRAMLQVIDSGGQAALLAPTEVLAQQHYHSIRRALGPMAEPGMLGSAEQGTRVDLLTGSMTASKKKEVLLRAASGETGILVGTHALLSDTVSFADLGLIVVDEQHRFGVEQRDVLRNKALNPPHMLVMTATPIPRTVAMTVFGDLEVSLMRGLPFGRAPITTHLVPLNDERFRSRMFGLMREVVSHGHQVYVVCPRITEVALEEDAELLDPDAEPPVTGRKPAPKSDKPPSMTVEKMLELLKGNSAFDGVGIGVLHGKLPADAKRAAMVDFEQARTQILVSTTVIEVGVDVPNATLMVVVDADSFGISQLHQLRGRIGRGQNAGTCLLASWLPTDHPSMARLNAVQSTTDGFELAEADLEERREGDILGASQSGSKSTLRLLRVMKHAKTIAKARAEAESLIAGDRELSRYPALARSVGEWVDEDMQAFLERG
ncbi:ATP-dependent DNA helicase RecG [Paeniglutamicibacter cryotolerans]|uniref:Probable DNA 3'-5' helicase RecG n=1 Tax=Paeniglutamicibacter cryotolerans TaxID=670079 RepID=A0A839QVV2_9MICC|nr:ATP-dependent DNA helicase RecG [Paeniglutamicibacter cryotolerans]MBB2997432.1 ATP-dependent DNA helicase RecG [Paeniglutamicibacter cryotolerans]